MDALFTEIIKKTELKNWTLFLFIFAICYAKGLQIITGHWFHIPDADGKFNQTTLFLLDVFLSSITITRILVAIKFLEAINRTPIIADIINWVVVDRRVMILSFNLPNRNRDDETKIPTIMGWSLGYKHGITENKAWFLINENFIIDNGFPDYKRCKKAIGRKTFIECSTKKLALGHCIFTLHPAIYRDWDRKYAGGFWIPKRPLCLEHFLMSATIFLIGSGAVKFLEWVIGHFL